MSMETNPPAPKPDKVTKTANGLANKADTKISEMARKAEAAARRAETALHEGVETMRTQGRVYADQAVQKFESGRETVREQVRERPITGLMAAAGVGFLLGLLVARRH
jgi:ElaB/YqjD/DUF883 family membrane-anchored ribosome-binding protein